jgi:hypothetical protein
MVRWRGFRVVFVVAALTGAGGISSGLVAPAWANEACAKIQNPFQYNECLARQAPGRAARGGRRAGGTGGADPESSVPARRRNAAAPQVQETPGISIRRSSGRRVSATIDPWSGSRNVAPQKKRRR